MRRRASLAAAAAVLFLTACGDDRRDEISRYIGEVNAVQKRSAGEFKAANRAYAGFAEGRKAARGLGPRLRSAEAAMREARRDVAAIEPPGDAKALHDDLVHLFDLNIAFAGEANRLARYSPGASAALAPLDRLDRRLRKELLSGAGEAPALRGYAAGMGAAARRLERLDPPPVLEPSHRAQLRRLRGVRAVAGRLATAIAERDAPTVGRLLKRFRATVGRAGEGGEATAIAAYNRRYREISGAAQAVQRRLTALDRSLD